MALGAAAFFPTAERFGVRVGLVNLPVRLLGFAGAYFAAAKIGIATSLPPEGIVIFWPPNAILLAFLLAARPQQWWLFFITTVLTEIAADVPAYPLWAAAGYGAVNFGESALAAALLLNFSGRPRSLVGLRSFVVYVICGPFLASSIAALFGAAIYKIGQPTIDYFHYFRVFWFGDAVGLLVVGTVLLSISGPVGIGGRNKRHVAAELAGLGLSLVAVSAVVFFANPNPPVIYLIFPLLLWAAVRFGPHGAAMAVSITVAVAIGTAVNGIGPFTGLSAIENVTALQGLVAVVSLSTFMLAFACQDVQQSSERLEKEVGEHRHTEERLRLALMELNLTNSGLDKLVGARTSELARALKRNESLSKEVHHRTKNFLQIVGSIVRLHSKSARDPFIRERFDELQGQIGTIRRTYETLQVQMRGSEVIDCCELIPLLCENIMDAAGRQITVTSEVMKGAFLCADGVVPIALAVNELIANHFKCAPVGTTVRIVCEIEGEEVILGFKDDGTGLHADFDIEATKDFGMQMVKTLVEQAQGRIGFRNTGEGTTVEIIVPAMHHE